MTLNKKQQKLVEDNIGLANFLVETVTGLSVSSRVSFDELRSAAYLGLVEAADAFDPEADAPFSAWARIRIMGAIVDEIRNSKVWLVRATDPNASEMHTFTDERFIEEMIPSRERDPAEILEEKDFVEAALRELPDRTALAVKLRMGFGVEPQVVADILGVRLSMMHRIVSDGVKALRRIGGRRQ